MYVDSSSIKCSVRLRLHTVIGLIFLLSMISLLSTLFISSYYQYLFLCVQMNCDTPFQIVDVVKVSKSLNEFTVFYFCFTQSTKL
jgi:hypothetical protein